MQLLNNLTQRLSLSELLSLRPAAPAASSTSAATDIDTIRIGIQGGRGSYNHAAFLEYGAPALEQIAQVASTYQLDYRFTTSAVLEALDAGEIDYGQFALSNSRGGAVEETIRVIGQHQFVVAAQYDLSIDHHLLIHPDTALDEIETIMTHPQVIQQCRATLRERYPHLQLTSGSGDLIDHAAVAAALSSDELPRTTAVMGPAALADLYNLVSADHSLQDDPHNTTSFMLVTK